MTWTDSQCCFITTGSKSLGTFGPSCQDCFLVTVKLMICIWSPRRHLLMQSKNLSLWPAVHLCSDICGFLAQEFCALSVVPFLREVHLLRPLLETQSELAPALSWANSLWMWCTSLIKSCCSISPLLPAINCRFACIAILDLVTLSKQFNTI